MNLFADAAMIVDATVFVASIFGLIFVGRESGQSS